MSQILKQKSYRLLVVFSFLTILIAMFCVFIADSEELVLADIENLGGDCEIVGGDEFKISLRRIAQSKFELSRLKRLRNLRELEIGPRKDNGEDFGSIGFHPKLLILSIRHYRELENLHDLSRNAPNLASLAIHGTVVGNRAISEIKSFPKLKSLSLTRSRIPNLSGQYLSELKSLKWISVSHTDISDSFFEAFSETKSEIESIDAADTRITDRSMTYFKNFEHLKELRLSGTDITGSSLSEIKYLKLLKLDLSGCKITDESISTLAEMPELTWLSLEGTNVTHQCIQTLNESPSLSYLFLGGKQYQRGKEMGPFEEVEVELDMENAECVNGLRQ